MYVDNGIDHVRPELRPRRFRRLAVALAVVAALVGLLAACNPPPGHARVKLTGDVNGSASGPTVTCEGFNDEYAYNAAWHWTGDIAGESTTVNVYRFGVDHIVVVDRGDEHWDGYPDWDGVVEQDGDTLRIEVGLREMFIPENNPPTMQLTFVVTCPA